jgi:Fuc2NAc and GlcNAc transferase
MLLVILAGVSLVISLSIAGLMAKGNYLLDIPSDRSSHTQPTARGGGVGFVLAFAITSTILSPKEFGLWLVLTPLAIVGILDDFYNLPASIRYLVQLISAVMAVVCFGSGNFTLASIGTVIAITALINFYNFFDGLDGLLAGVCVVQLSFLALYLNQQQWLLLVAALGGFLWWNWSPAKIFMGDVGSTFLGASVAVSLLNASNNYLHAWSAFAVTLPLVTDTIYTLIRRLLKQENIFQAHRSHLYQRLQQAGWTHQRVAMVYIGFTSAIALSVGFGGKYGVIGSIGATAIALIAGEVFIIRQQKLDANDGSTTTPATTPP